MKKVLLLMILFIPLLVRAQIKFNVTPSEFSKPDDILTLMPTSDPSYAEQLEMEQQISPGVWMNAFTQEKFGFSSVKKSVYDFTSKKWRSLPIFAYKKGTYPQYPNIGFTYGDDVRVKVWLYKAGFLVDSGTFAIAIKKPTGFASIFENESSVLIRPNPVVNSIFIDSKKEKIREVTIYDLVGREILVQKTNSQPYVIDVSKIKPGCYFITLYTEDKNKITKRFLKE